MTYNAINELIASAEASGHDSFWEYDGEFFMLFYNRFRNTPFTDIPDIAFMYMEMNNWQGMSARCGYGNIMRAAYTITQMNGIRKTVITQRNGSMKRKE